MQKKLDGEARAEVDDYQEPVEEYNEAVQQRTERNAS